MGRKPPRKSIQSEGQVCIQKLGAPQMWPFCWDLVNLKLMMLMFSPLEDFNFSMSIYVRIAFYLQISHGMSCGRLVGAPALRFSVPLPFPLDAKALPDELENEQSWLVRSIFIHFYISDDNL